MALCLLVTPAVALVTVEACGSSKPESGMYVGNAQAFGYPGSGFVWPQLQQMLNWPLAMFPPGTV